MSALLKHENTTGDYAGGRALGFASLAIGLAEILIPHKIEKLLGIATGRHTGILRVLGVRELAHAADILAHPDPTHGVHSRVAGDALDGALFAIAGTRTRNPSGYAAAAVMLSVVTAADLLFAKRLSGD